MVHPADPARLRALVSLLSDENPRIVAEARRALREHGSRSLPYLDWAIEEGDAKLRARARLVRETVHLGLIEAEMRTLGERIDHHESALEEGCILLARTRDHDLDPSTIRAALDALADDLGSRLGPERRHGASLTPVAVVQAMTRFLAREVGFHGAQRNYYDPDNSYLHKVLERRIGIPISLSAVYLFIARRLGLPLHGIGLPGHFILRYGSDEPALLIDPFHGGRVFDEAEISRYLEEHDAGGEPPDLLVMSDGAILLRVIRNLLQIYRTRGDPIRLEVLQRMKSVLVGEELSGSERTSGDAER